MPLSFSIKYLKIKFFYKALTDYTFEIVKEKIQLHKNLNLIMCYVNHNLVSNKQVTYNDINMYIQLKIVLKL